MGTRTGNPAWQNLPSTTSPISAEALQAIEDALDDSPSVDDLDAKAPTNSPTFTGTPTAPTPATNDNDASIATTAFVRGQIAFEAVTKGLVDAKGDLLVATANDTVTRVGVGSNGQVLTADSAEASGVKWAPSGGSGVACAIPAVGEWASSQYLGTSSAGKSLGTNQVCFIDTGAGYTVDQAAFTIATAGAAGDTAHVELYARNALGNIGALLTNGASGTAAVSATGTVTCTFSTPCALPAGGVFALVKSDVKTGDPKVICFAAFGPGVGVQSTAVNALQMGTGFPLPLGGNPSVGDRGNAVVLRRSA